MPQNNRACNPEFLSISRGNWAQPALDAINQIPLDTFRDLDRVQEWLDGLDGEDGQDAPIPPFLMPLFQNFLMPMFNMVNQMQHFREFGDNIAVGIDNFAKHMGDVQNNQKIMNVDNAMLVKWQGPNAVNKPHHIRLSPQILPPLNINLEPVGTEEDKRPVYDPLNISGGTDDDQYYLAILYCNSRRGIQSRDWRHKKLRGYIMPWVIVGKPGGGVQEDPDDPGLPEGKVKVDELDKLDYLEDQFVNSTATAYNASIHAPIHSHTKNISGTNDQLDLYVVEADLSGVNTDVLVAVTSGGSGVYLESAMTFTTATAYNASNHDQVWSDNSGGKLALYIVTPTSGSTDELVAVTSGGTGVYLESAPDVRHSHGIQRHPPQRGI